MDLFYRNNVNIKKDPHPSGKKYFFKKFLLKENFVITKEKKEYFHITISIHLFIYEEINVVGSEPSNVSGAMSVPCLS